MNAERLLAHYHEVADAPDAIARLRQFILDLAVRGNLVPQDATDKPASELLKQIAADKAERAISARDRSATEIKPLLGDDLPFSIPSNWLWVSFGDIAISRDGERIPVSREERDQRAKVYDYYGASGVIDKIDGYLFDQPLLLIGEDGANLINRSTPIAFIARGKFWVNNQAHVLDGLSEMFLRYLEMFINAIDLKRYVTGTAQPKMNQAKMNSIPVALPPIAEQQRIVAKVDELMGLCDRLEEARSSREAVRDRLSAASFARFNAADSDTFQTDAGFALSALPALTTRPDQVERLRQTILNLAVRGKLVPQDPKDEPASELLSKKAELPDGYQRRRKILKQTSVATPDHIFPSIPATWAYTDVQTLYDLNAIVDYADGNHGSLYPRSSDFGESGVTFVTAKDLAHGRVVWESCAKLNQECANQLTKGWAQGGDILLTHNATVGRVAQVEPSVGRFLLGTSVTFYRLNCRVIDPGYFSVMLISPAWQGQLEAIMAQTTRNQVSIQKQAFFKLAVPPLAEQHRIVAKVDSLMALCGRLEANLTATATTRRRLLDALLAEALAPIEDRELEAAE